MKKSKIKEIDGKLKTENGTYNYTIEVYSSTVTITINGHYSKTYNINNPKDVRNNRDLKNQKIIVENVCENTNEFKILRKENFELTRTDMARPN